MHHALASCGTGGLRIGLRRRVRLGPAVPARRQIESRRPIVLVGIVALGIASVTAIDKFDERPCRQDPAIVATKTIPNPSYDPTVPEGAKLARFVYEECDGYVRSKRLGVTVE